MERDIPLPPLLSLLAPYESHRLSLHSVESWTLSPPYKPAQFAVSSLTQPVVPMPRLRSLLPSLSSRAVLWKGVFRFLSLAVLCAVVYRYCYLEYSDPYKCRALLHEGQWLEIGDESRGVAKWQPPGCMIAQYEKEEIGACLGKKRMLIVGDSTTRQIFWAIARKLDWERANTEMQDFLYTTPKAVDIEFTVDEIKLEFVWDPYLNSSRLEAELDDFRKTAQHELANEESAGLILLGAPGLWYARKSGANHIRKFKEALDQVVPYMDHSPQPQSSFRDWSSPPANDPARNLLLIAPVRTPWYPSLSPSRQESLTPERIDPLNELLQELSFHQGADVAWCFANMTYRQESAYEYSGLHVVRNVADAEADVLLNLRCNTVLAEEGYYPHDGTCCMNYHRPDWRQKIVMQFALFSILLLSLNRQKHFLERSRFLPSAEFLRPFSAFALILCFCYLADRTQLFAKEERSCNTTEFLSACVIMAVMGAVSVEKMVIPARNGYSDYQNQEQQTWLCRKQTDEWKGWMQALLLLIHYTNASEDLWVHAISQILGAGFLFVTGYAHTVYFLTTSDYSLNRVAHILIRLNLFECILAYMMRTEYAFYHYAPVASFWFLINYCVLHIKQSVNDQPTYLILMILLSACFITGLVLTPNVLENIFNVLNITLRIEWDAILLREVISQNLYIVYVGMIFAVLSHRSCSLNSQSPSTPSAIDTPLNYIHRNSSALGPPLGLLALGILPLYWIITVAPHSKLEDYDNLHPYLSFIPILCFLALRNCTALFRTHHSKLFIWLGRHSLELYLLKHHIWLAGDSYGILRIGLTGRRTEFVIITTLFLCVSATLKDVTSLLVEWIVSGRMGAVRRGRSGGDWDESSSSNDRRWWRADESYELGGTRSHVDTNSLVLQEYSSMPDGEGTPSKNHGFNMLGMWGDLRGRLGVVVVVGWVLNISYR